MVSVLPEDRMRDMLEMLSVLPEDRMRDMLEMVSASAQGRSASQPVRILPTVLATPMTERIRAA